MKYVQWRIIKKHREMDIDIDRYILVYIDRYKDRDRSIDK